MNDDNARLLARTCLNKNLVVEAGAGTGKTMLLVERLLFLAVAGGLSGDGLPMEAIVALTFTEKAAAEIKTRLTQRLQELLRHLGRRPQNNDDTKQAQRFLDDVKSHFQKSESQVQERVSTALSQLDLAVIGTLHHFASRLLRLYPLEAGVDPAFQVDDGRALREEFQNAWPLWLETELGENPPHAPLWLEVLEHATLEDLMPLALAMCQSEGGLRDKDSFAQEFLADWGKRLAQLPAGKPPPPKRGNALAEMARLSQGFQDLKNHLDAQPFPPIQDSESLRECRAVWPSVWKGLPGEELWEDAKKLSGRVSFVSEGLVRRAVYLLAPFVREFKKRASQSGTLSYDQLLEKARALVWENKNVRGELKRRFQTFLIDEFQDTDPLQGEMILYLAEVPDAHARHWPDISLAPGKLFVVGDPKQSIYRFRGASIAAYERFTGLLLQQGAERCVLRTNFRSPSDLVQSVNSVFSALLVEDPGRQPSYESLASRPAEEGAKNTSPAITTVVVKHPEEGDALLREVSHRLQARWTARWVREQCGPRGPYSHKQVAVLFRTTSALPLFVEVFKEAGLPVVVDSDRYFYGTPEVWDFINLLRVLDDPRDAVSFLGLLRSPVVALEDKEIFALSQNSPLSYGVEGPSSLSGPSGQRFDAFCSALRSLRQWVGREPLGPFVNRVLRNTPLLELCSAAYAKDQTASNLIKFARLASDAGLAQGVTLKEFIHEVESRRDNVREGESPLADEDHDAVRFLTIHKAKGLEFPVVFVPITSSAPRGKMSAKPLRFDWVTKRQGHRVPGPNFSDIVMAAMELEEDKREAAEHVRLLYVAMTRAKERLFLLGDGGRADKSSFAALLKRARAWPLPGDTQSPLGSVVSVSPGEVIPLTPLPRKPTLLPAPQEAATDAGWKKAQGIFEQQQGVPVFLSPSQAHPLPLQGRVSGAGGGERAALLGTLCHRVMELWDSKRPSEWKGLAARVASVLSIDAPEAPWKELTQEAQEILGRFFASPEGQALAGAQILGREVPFLMSSPQGVVRGVVDVVFREAGRLWAADYKTDTLPPGTDLNDWAKRYIPQGQAYQEALQQAAGEPCGFRFYFLRRSQSVDLFSLEQKTLK